MVYMRDMSDAAFDRIMTQELPDYGTTPCRQGPPCRVGEISLVLHTMLHHASKQ